MSTPSVPHRSVSNERPTSSPESPAVSSGRQPLGRSRWWAVGLASAAAVVVLAAAFASPDPDGLERVAKDYGFFDRAQGALYHLIPDYRLPGIGDALLATVGAGLLGLLVVFGIVFGLGLLLRRRSA